MDFFKRKRKADPVAAATASIGRKKAVIWKLVRVTAGKRHAYYESDAGVIRKPIRSY